MAALHNAVNFTSRHCPPLDATIPAAGKAAMPALAAACNCVPGALGLGCVVSRNGLYDHYVTAQRNEAVKTQPRAPKGCENPGRPPNNIMRKRMYRYAALGMGYRARRPLPTCYVASVRTVYPDRQGNYMGFMNQ